ncbi:MAG TPA: hypothetical protein VFM96_05265 [Gaiellaceae bacterium]|nr:hypothetical protein [Gaiellaceae bacterium]
MRRIVVFSVFALALAVPAAGFALHATPGDGTLVVKDGTAPKGQAVVQLVITGSAIGRVRGLGKIVIDNATASSNPEVTGADGCKNLAADDPRQIYGSAILCTGNDFRFRAVADTYAITIYGSSVYLLAIGQGKAILTGTPGDPTDDGVYSLNGGDFHSLPGIASKPLLIGLPIG